ncbi:MBL fold metallo-hydrolase [Estrella lausannensis]|uniref:Rhodanese domain-containing protein n=1 Tax=Estrella lausannensis TaxID=483423 RepID=A0A0H5DMY2_9BACT|nr:rhodanese-like domain-containing protein [Estrella lausannensis]CRX37367.1 hypothetical protein ELAC_0003 [Estrella lausannensis]
MFFYKRFIPGLAILSYMIGDEKSKECAVIDPVRDVEEYLNVAKANGYTIKYILETHVHADFVSGSKDLKDKLHGKPLIYCSALGGKEWLPSYCDHAVEDGDTIVFGNLQLTAMHTPGHTPEHIVWLAYDLARSKETPWFVFTGDLLFVGDVGRPDLLGKEKLEKLEDDLYLSLFDKLKPLPDFVEIFPGHGQGSLCGKSLGSRDSSTLGFERQFNPALRFQEKKAWTLKLMENMPKAPSYFSRMKKANVKGSKPLSDVLQGLKLIKKEADEIVWIDTRPSTLFLKDHQPGTLWLPRNPKFAPWASYILPYDKPLGIIATTAEEARQAAVELARVGLDTIVGYTLDPVNGGLSEIEYIAPPTLKTALKQGEEVSVIDVREPSEWAQGHIEGAVPVPLAELSSKNFSSEGNSKLVFVCASGTRALIAASYFDAQGLKNVRVLEGGMSAWN